MRTTHKPSKEQQILEAIKSYIYTNRAMFQAGNEVQIQPILDAYGLQEPTYSSNPEETISQYKSWTLQVLTWQNRFNRILAQRGLYMSRKGNSWVLKSPHQTADKVKSFKVRSQRSMARHVELKQGITRFRSKLAQPVGKVVLSRLAKQSYINFARV